MWILFASLALAGDVAWYLDADNDGYGDGSDWVIAPEGSEPTGRVGNDQDCNDATAAVSPAATEQCNGLDDNCDGFIDGPSACPVCSFEMYGDHGYALCDTGAGVSLRTNWLTAEEVCQSADYHLVTIETEAEDDWLRGAVRDIALARQWWIGLNDRSSEGRFQWVSGISSPYLNWGSTQPDDWFGEDCATTNWGSAWNDTDCGDVLPYVCETEGDPRPWWVDGDGDGFGDAGESAAPAVWAHAQPAGYAPNNADCDDGRAATFPGADERCNNVDDDCNGQVDDDAVDLQTVYADGDGDGFGAGAAVQLCATQLEGYSAVSSDCNDADQAVHPDADELCDGIDNNCDDIIDDDATNASIWALDVDGDGVAGQEEQRSCEQPDNAVDITGDCDDSDPERSPLLPELCDGIDNDCDDQVDVDAENQTPWYVDADSDGYGAGEATLRCEADANEVAVDGDCDDANDTVYPGAPELEDGLDNDCNGTTELDDLDGDGLTNDREAELGTDPDNPDTDGGGVGDGVEVDRGTDPLDASDDVEAPDDTAAPVSSRQFEADGGALSVPSGCGCSSAQAAGGWLGLLPLLAMAWRRGQARTGSSRRRHSPR